MHMRGGAQTVGMAQRNVLFGGRDQIRNDGRSFMSDIFAMQRANGDWFALDHYGRLRVPIFHSIHDALMARLHDFGLLLFQPVAVDALFLKEIVPLPGEDEVDFCLIEDPFASLTRGATVGRRELALLIRPADENIASNGSDPGALPQSDRQATETWEDEGGTSAKYVS